MTEECPICFNELTTYNYITLNCSHKCCRECYENCLTNHNLTEPNPDHRVLGNIVQERLVKCPLCRKPHNSNTDSELLELYRNLHRQRVVVRRIPNQPLPQPVIINDPIQYLRDANIPITETTLGYLRGRLTTNPDNENTLIEFEEEVVEEVVEEEVVLQRPHPRRLRCQRFECQTRTQRRCPACNNNYACRRCNLCEECM